MGCGSSANAEESSDSKYKATDVDDRTTRRLKLTKGALGSIHKIEVDDARKQSILLSPRKSAGNGNGAGTDLARTDLMNLDKFNGDLGASFVLRDDKSDKDEETTSVSMSDAESTLTTESFFEVLGKRVNRPRSAKGHPAEQPSFEVTQQRILAKVLKGSLEGIDGSVEPSIMIRESNWLRWLRAHGDPHGHSPKEETVKDAVDGSQLPIVSMLTTSEETTLDAIVEFLEKNEPKQEVESDSDSSSNFSEAGGQEKEELVRDTGNSEDRGGHRHLGRHHFRGKRQRIYYTRVVKPWILSYLQQVEAIDPQISPVFAPEQPVTPGASPKPSSLEWNDAFNRSLAHQSSIGGLTTSTAAKESPNVKTHDAQMAEDDVLKMMLSPTA